MGKRSRKNTRKIADIPADELMAKVDGAHSQTTPNEPFPNGEPELNGRDGTEEETFTPDEGVLSDESVEAEAAALAEVGEDVTDQGEADKPNSVVAEKFKLKYIENAKAAGWKGKAAKRSNWDWLAQTIAANCLGEKEKIDIGQFCALLEANGVDHAKWPNRNKGWEGRLRMTGRVVLQRIVADSGVLKLADGSEAAAPEEWRARFKSKEEAKAS